MATHVKTIGPQQDSVRSTLRITLPKLGKDLHGIEPRLAPILTCKTDESMAALSKRVVIEHSQVSSNIKTCEIECISNIDDPISPDSNLTLRKLIMDLKTEDGEIFAITITHN